MTPEGTFCMKGSIARSFAVYYILRSKGWALYSYSIDLIATTGVFM